MASPSVERVDRRGRRQRPLARRPEPGRRRSELELAVGVRDRSRDGHERPAWRRRASRRAGERRCPPVESAIAMSGGVPRRPASAMTTPADRDTGPDRPLPRVRDRRRSGGGVGRRRGRRRRGGVGAGRWRRRRGWCRRRGRGGSRRRRRRRDDGELAGERRVEPVSGKAGPAAVALTERPGCRDGVAGLDGRAREGGIGRRSPERPAAIVDRDPEPVRQLARRRRDGPGDRQAEAFERLARLAGRRGQWQRGAPLDPATAIALPSAAGRAG